MALETTDEHPLYVEGSGFAKAKEVGIGSSIVKRAGPGAKVVGVQADVRQATVYNFTVDEFHTYFVGEAALWVHNADDCIAPLTKINGGGPDNFIWGEIRPNGGVEYLVQASDKSLKRGPQMFEELIAEMGGIDKAKFFNCNFVESNASAINAKLKAGASLETALKETTTFRWLQNSFPGENFSAWDFSTLRTSGSFGEYTSVQIQLFRRTG